MKKLLLLLLVLSVLCTAVSGCEGEKKEPASPSDYSFVNVEWTRESEQCIETIYFHDDGNCGYYCACGEPVNDDDLCQGYTYDPKTQTIHLDFAETTPETVTEITVKSCDGETLVLDFNGDVRTFEKVEKGEPDDFESDVVYGGERYVYLEYNPDIFYYDLSQSVAYEEDELLPIPHSKWNLVYHNGDLFVLQSQAEEAIAYYGDDDNYHWSVWIDNPETEESHTFPLALDSREITYLYGMESMEWETTMFFDDIEIFASLVKTSNDGLIAASTSLAYYENAWYWRSEIIDDGVEGWPEYVVKLPDTLSNQITGLCASLNCP